LAGASRWFDPASPVGTSLRLTRRLTTAILIALSMLAACNAAASPSAGSSASAAASPSAGSSLTGPAWAQSSATGNAPAFTS
jgi:hypothetical protein